MVLAARWSLHAWRQKPKGVCLCLYQVWLLLTSIDQIPGSAHLATYIPLRPKLRPVPLPQRCACAMPAARKAASSMPTQQVMQGCVCCLQLPLLS